VQALMLSGRAQTTLLLTATAGGGGTDEARTSRIRRLSLEMNLAVPGEARPAQPAACLLLSEEAMRQAILKAVEFTERLTHRASPPRVAAAAAAAAAGAKAPEAPEVGAEGAGGGSRGSPGSEEAADASEDDLGLEDGGEENAPAA